MPVQPPSRQELQRIAEQEFGFSLSDEELETFAAAAPGTIAGFTRLDELPDEHLPVKYPRADLGHRPTGAENPSNGWAWKCSIPGAAAANVSSSSSDSENPNCCSAMRCSSWREGGWTGTATSSWGRAEARP